MKPINKLSTSTALLTALSSTGADAQSLSWTTQFACAADYYAYCSQYSLGTEGVKKCMAKHGAKLSPSCINGLVSDKYITKAQVFAKAKEEGIVIKDTPSGLVVDQVATAALKRKKAKPEEPKVEVAVVPQSAVPVTIAPVIVASADPKTIPSLIAPTVIKTKVVVKKVEKKKLKKYKVEKAESFDFWTCGPTAGTGHSSFYKINCMKK